MKINELTRRELEDVQNLVRLEIMSAEEAVIKIIAIILEQGTE